MPRGRKSAASISVVPVLPGRGRPEPPDDLDARNSASEPGDQRCPTK
jgi:hypothetical protein